MVRDKPLPTEGLRKSERTRESILDAARIAFARKGFSGVNIRDIADLSGVTRANFYYYFRDKTELFIVLGTATYRETLEVVEAFGEAIDGQERFHVHDWVNAYFDNLDRNGAFIIRSLEDAPEDRGFRTAVARSHRRTATALGDRIAKVAETPPHCDAFALGLAVMAMLERSWLMSQRKEIMSISKDVLVHAISELIGGLAHGYHHTKEHHV